MKNKLTERLYEDRAFREGYVIATTNQMEKKGRQIRRLRQIYCKCKKQINKCGYCENLDKIFREEKK